MNTAEFYFFLGLIIWNCLITFAVKELYNEIIEFKKKMKRDLTIRFQNHVEKRIKEMREREFNFMSKNKYVYRGMN